MSSGKGMDAARDGRGKGGVSVDADGEKMCVDIGPGLDCDRDEVAAPDVVHEARGRRGDETVCCTVKEADHLAVVVDVLVKIHDLGFNGKRIGVDRNLSGCTWQWRKADGCQLQYVKAK